MSVNEYSVKEGIMGKTPQKLKERQSETTGSIIICLLYYNIQCSWGQGFVHSNVFIFVSLGNSRMPQI